MCKELRDLVDHTFSASFDVASLDELVHGFLVPFSLHTNTQMQTVLHKPINPGTLTPEELYTQGCCRQQRLPASCLMFECFSELFYNTQQDIVCCSFLRCATPVMCQIGIADMVNSTIVPYEK